MSIEKFRTRIFVTSKLTVNGDLVIPYTTAAPTVTDNGEIAIANYGGSAKLVFRSGGTVFTMGMPSTSGGSVICTFA